MTLLLFLLFIIPIALLVNSLVDPVARLFAPFQRRSDAAGSRLAEQHSGGGRKLYSGWHSLLEMGGSALMAKVRPYIGTTTTWFVGQAAHIGRFMMHCTLMLVFSALLYWRGEQVALGFVTLPPDWRVNAAMRRCCWRSGRPRRGAGRGGDRAGAGGAGRYRSGDFRRAVRHLFTVVMLMTCLAQLGPLLVLVPCIIWLYWTGIPPGAPCCWSGAAWSAPWITSFARC
jgi:predicted PurR-regulated permease PerM